jgi:hypothetical protein
MGLPLFSPTAHAAVHDQTPNPYIECGGYRSPASTFTLIPTGGYSGPGTDLEPDCGGAWSAATTPTSATVTWDYQHYNQVYYDNTDPSTYQVNFYAYIPPNLQNPAYVTYTISFHMGGEDQTKSVSLTQQPTAQQPATLNAGENWMHLTTIEIQPENTLMLYNIVLSTSQQTSNQHMAEDAILIEVNH